jgi:REP element-mobilizing transposase RayT
LYHVIARGNDRREIFLDDADRRRYLALLRVGCMDLSLTIYAYALMPNHVHLLVMTRLANISSAICRVHLAYSKYFNMRHGRSGHVFGARFKSRLVEKDRYFLALLRYIHLNPVRAGLAAAPGEYAWSSYGAYLGGRDGLVRRTWEALRMFSDDPKAGLARYLEFMGQPIPEPELRLLDTTRNGILGGPAFHALLSGKR